MAAMGLLTEEGLALACGPRRMGDHALTLALHVLLLLLLEHLLLSLIHMLHMGVGIGAGR